MRRFSTIVILSILLVLPVSTLYQPLYPVFAEERSPLGRGKAQLQKDKIASKTAERRVKVGSVSEELREKRASREAELKNKLAQFRNKKKAGVVEKVNQRLLEINTRSTSHFQDVIDKMNSIVEKLEAKVKEAETNGIDVVSAKNALSEAKAAITAAQNSVDAQVEKDYSIVITTETKVGEDARMAKNNLRNDLKSTHDLIVTAKQSVAKVISTTVSTIGGENNGSNN